MSPTRTLLSALLFAVPALHASTITYDVTLTPTSGQYAGSGTLILASAPAASGISTFSQANGQLQGLTFTIDNQAFSLSGDPSTTVQFVDGQLAEINFSQSVSHPPARYTLQLSNGFAFYGNDFGHPLSDGSLTAALADTPSDSSSTQPPSTSATPEPGSLILLATALLGGGFLLFRRRRTAHS